MKLERRIEFDPAYDKRPEYGIHGVEIRWLVVGEKGAIQFLLYTNWQLPHVEKELDSRHGDTRFPHLSCHPLPADIGYHAYVPQYEGQEPLTSECLILGGKPCYYDGSGLRARDFYALLVAQGGDALWAALEKEYAERFEQVAA